MEEPNDNPLLELEESPYLRRQKQVEVRRSRLKSRAFARIRMFGLAGLALAALCFLGYRMVVFGLHSPRFRLSENNLEIAGLKYVSRHQVAEKFAGDVGRSIFMAPLARRRAMVEEISWVEAAAVSRAWPDRLRVTLRERVPVGFLRTSTGLSLVDREGIIMERPSRAAFTFPVISGFTEHDAPDMRHERMRLYLDMMEDLDSDGARHSLDISEVDLSDPEDARAVVAGRDGTEPVLVHLGNSHFLARYRTYLAHIRQWRQQFEKIHSVDLRYERQIVVNPDRR